MPACGVDVPLQALLLLSYRIKKEWWDQIPNPAHSPLVAIFIQEPQVRRGVGLGELPVSGHLGSLEGLAWWRNILDGFRGGRLSSFMWSQEPRAVSPLPSSGLEELLSARARSPGGE